MILPFHFSRIRRVLNVHTEGLLDLILVQFAFLWICNFLCFGLLYLGFTSQSTTTMWWSDMPGTVLQDFTTLG